jgi:Holliday junction resolvase-like predicted endonuclease
MREKRAERDAQFSYRPELVASERRRRNASQESVDRQKQERIQREAEAAAKQSKPESDTRHRLRVPKRVQQIMDLMGRNADRKAQ